MKKGVLLLLCLLYPTLLFSQNTLFFRKGKFIIAQFTDLHWDPKSPKCVETTQAIGTILESEKPDLAVLSGDVVSEDPAIEGWQAIVDIFNKHHVFFTVAMGNHDPEYLTRDEIYDFLLKSPYYVGEKGPKDISGCGNCVIPIYGSQKSDTVKALIYSIDSNDYETNKLYGMYDKIHFDQIEWYREQSRIFTAKNGGKPLPSLAFFHIPLLEYNEVVKGGEFLGNYKDEGIGSSKINSGMFASFLDMKDVMGVFAGHDHNNDFIGIYKGVALGYGRVSGEDAYGDLTRGARIIELHEGEFSFDTWISTPLGKEPVYYFPSGLNSQEEQTMSYSPAVKVSPSKHGVEYRYYEGKCKSIENITLCEQKDSGVMKNFSIVEAPAEDHFAYQFRTFIKIPERGVYRFYTFSDDGSALYIDGKLVVNNDGGHSSRRVEGKIALEKGFHELNLLYFEDYMGQELNVGISGRFIKEKLLPDDILFLPN